MILHDIFDFTLKYPTKHIYCVGAHALVSLEPCNLAGADIILLDKSVLSYSFIFHRFPKIVVSNHFIHLPIDMLTVFGVQSY